MLEDKREDVSLDAPEPRRVDPVIEGMIARHSELTNILSSGKVHFTHEEAERFRVEVIGVKDGEWKVEAYFVDHLGFAMGGDLLHDVNSRLDKVIKQEEKWDEVLYCRILDLELDSEASLPDQYNTISRLMTEEFNEMYDNQSAREFMYVKQKIEAWASFIRKGSADCILAIAHAMPHGPMGQIGKIAVEALADHAVQFGQLNEMERGMVLGLIERQMEDEARDR